MATTKLTKHITFGDVTSDIPNGFPIIARLVTNQSSEATPNLENDITGYDNLYYYDTFSNTTISYSDFKTEVLRSRPVILDWGFTLSGGDSHLTLPLNYQTLNTPTLKLEYKGIINNTPTDTWVASTNKTYNCIISLNCTGSTPVFNYKNIRMVDNSPLLFTFHTPANPDWTSVSQQMLTLVSIKDTYDNTTRTDYAQILKELIGGRPVVINLANDNSASEHFSITFTSAAFKDNSVALVPIGTIGIAITGSGTTPGVTHYITGMIIVTSSGVNAYMLNNPPAPDLLKPIIIKTAAISGDPAVNDVITLTASEIYDTAKGSTVTAANLFSNGTAGRRLVVYIQGAGLTLTPCELFPVYNTDYTTPVLFSGFTGIKFRGADRNNYYGIYVKLESDGTVKAIIEDRQVYNS